MKKLLLSITCAIAMLFSFVVPVTVTKADTEFRYVNNTVKDTYRLNTGMIGYATVTAFINNQADLDAIKGLRYDADKAPAMAFLYTKSVDGRLSVTSKDGEVITSLTDVLNNYTRNKVIPAFYLTAGDTQTALDLQEYLLKYEIKDAFVVSSDAQTLETCLKYYNTAGARAKLRATGMLEFIDCKNTSWREINETCSAVGARTCLINYKDKTEAEFEEFYSNSVYSAMTAYIKTDSATDMQSAVLGGAWAVVYDDWKETIDFIESFDKNTLVHDIIIQGHRGLDVYYQENTIEGIVVAAQSGYDSIEIDPRLTKDNQIVLMHDADVSRATGGLSGYVKDYTLEQLKSMSVIVNSSADPAPICSLEDVFVVYQKYGFTTRLALDAKETNEEYYQILYDLIEEYDMWAYIGSVGVADASDTSIAKELFNDYVSFDKVGGKTVECKETWQESIINWEEVLSSADRAYGSVAMYYTQLCKSASDTAQPEVVRAASDRGIKLRPYQFDTVELLEEIFLLQIDVISTGMGTYLSDFVENFVVDTNAATAQVNGKIELAGTVSTVNGQKSSVIATSYKVIGGDGSILALKENGIFAVKEGTVTVLPATSFKKGNIEYEVYSAPVTVTVTAASVGTDEDAKGDDPANELVGGCAANFSSGGFVSVIAMGVALVSTLKKKGDRTNEN